MFQKLKERGVLIGLAHKFMPESYLHLIKFMGYQACNEPKRKHLYKVVGSYENAGRIKKAIFMNGILNMVRLKNITSEVNI